MYTRKMSKVLTVTFCCMPISELSIGVLPSLKEQYCCGTGAAVWDNLSTAVLVSPLGANPATPITLAVSGPPRRMPDAKHSQWAIDRMPLEAALPGNATEGLLCAPGGRALEGFISNFFVVTGEALVAAHHPP